MHLFVAAAGVVAVHAAVDSFHGPEPGTGAGDHVLRGSSSLAVLALAAVLYPRLLLEDARRPPRRSACSRSRALNLAIADTHAVGARGEDWTGFLLLPVGLVLLGLAGSLAWRSRKPGRRPRPLGRR